MFRKMLCRQWKTVAAAVVLSVFVSAEGWAEADTGGESRVRKLHFVQDDAQDYMVSKIYVLKYVQSNDITPFVTGIVKRYNMNSSVGCIEYGSGNEQILTVTCPESMMPYVDDFIAKVDRKVEIDGKVPGEIMRGTGITRATYRPKYRSGQVLVNLIVNALLNAGPYSSVYGYDANSNQIYWKDNLTNSQYISQFLGFVDRPAPQISLNFTIYELRESELRDLGIEYLAWKNGPGLNIFQTAFRAFDLSSSGTTALQSLSGPLGGFFFAPQFDASFIRILAQSGKAEIKNTANLSVSNSDSRSYQIFFNPELQNIVKSNNDRTSVSVSDVAGLDGINQIFLEIIKPVVCLHSGKEEVEFAIADYQPGDYTRLPGTMFMTYNIQSANVVERNNYGAELIDTNSVSGSTSFALNREKLLASWSRTEEVEQTIGVPWLSEIPVLKYIFGTTTTQTEKINVYLTVTAEMLNTAAPSAEAGRLCRLK